MTDERYINAMNDNRRLLDEKDKLINKVRECEMRITNFEREKLKDEQQSFRNHDVTRMLVGDEHNGWQERMRVADFDDWLNDCFSRQAMMYDDFPNGDKSYRRDMVLAAIVELVEVLTTRAWKPWSNRTDEKVQVVRMDEIADVMLFLGNLIIVEAYPLEEGQTPASVLRIALQRKRKVVDQRLESGTYRG